MKHGLPLPVQVSSLSGKQQQQQQSTTEQSVVSTNPFPADQSNGGKCFNSNNPFVQDTFKESGEKEILLIEELLTKISNQVQLVLIRDKMQQTLLVTEEMSLILKLFKGGIIN